MQALTDFRHHRVTQLLPALRRLDQDFTRQWVGVNTAKTATAGLSIAAFVTLFVLPPVGIGLGIGAAVTGAGTSVTDWWMERIRNGEFQNILRQDQVLDARLMDFLPQTEGEHNATWRALIAAVMNSCVHPGPSTCTAAKTTVDGIVQFAQWADDIPAGAVATRVAAGTAAKVCAGGAMIWTIGDAAYSWATSKDAQRELRQKIALIEEQLASIEEALWALAPLLATT